MAELDWHAERTDLADLVMLDAPPPDLVDERGVRTYRLSRVRAEMKARNIAACILCDPVNIRYTSGTRNMQVFTARNAASRYLLVTQSDCILYEFLGCMHLAEGIETITETRPSIMASFVAAGDRVSEIETRWAREMADTIRELVGPDATVGMERLNAGATLALAEQGFRIVDAQAPVEMARAIKSAEEMKCIHASLRATEASVHLLRDAIRPGLTEVQLWSIMHQAVIAQNGDYIETRLINSGPRTNPWFQEAGTRHIGENELIALDTDVVGCYGYYSDFSRTFHSGPERPTETQRELYRYAYEQIHHNMDILRPGMSFREYTDKAWEIPERFLAHRYGLSAHGCGMTGEYPYLYHRVDFPEVGYDGEIRPGMTLCVESFIGDETGGEGVKLEQQVLITDTGIELLSQFPFEDALLN